MPTSVGPNTKGEENLVFGYDLGDTRNSFKGKPATNILKVLNSQYSDYNQTYFKVTNGTHIVDIPTLGPRTVKYIDVWNDYVGGSGNCCLGLFTFGTSITVTGGTDYMYQIIYKTDTGYTDTNYMYHYEYGASGYLTEYGLHSTSRRTHLGDGWYHAWGGFTTNASATYTNTYLFHYEYATLNRIQVAGVMLTQGTQVIPPDQFIGFEQTRSATQGLIDLTGNSTIDLTNVSFDSNAQMTFDGTDDIINIPAASWNILTTHTLEAVFKANGTGFNGYHVMFQKEGGYSGGAVYGLRALNAGGSLLAMICYDAQAANAKTLASTTLVTNGQYYHVVATFDSAYNWKIYINGVLENETTLTSNPYQNSSSIFIGRGDSRTMNGDLPIAKIYNRALTASEIKSNYNAIKGRFNI